jgi:DNA-binding response OmpR family regulator
MNVLIVESQQELGALWKAHLERSGMVVTQVDGQTQAIEYLTDFTPEIIILDLVLEDGNALSISDFASYKCPQVPVVFVTDTSFFSDGSIFSFAQNACAFLKSKTAPEDLTAMVQHYGRTTDFTPDREAS